MVNSKLCFELTGLIPVSYSLHGEVSWVKSLNFTPELIKKTIGAGKNRDAKLENEKKSGDSI